MAIAGQSRPVVVVARHELEEMALSVRVTPVLAWRELLVLRAHTLLPRALEPGAEVVREEADELYVKYHDQFISFYA